MLSTGELELASEGQEYFVGSGEVAGRELSVFSWCKLMWGFRLASGWHLPDLLHELG